MTESRPNILVVEDDECMRALVVLHLRNAGYEVSEAQDALIAGRALFLRRPDALIVDANLPYLSGLEFVAALVADTTIPHIPVVLMTAHEEFAAKADALGADCLVKPFVKARLLDAVAAALQRAKRRHAKDPVARLCERRSANEGLRAPRSPGS